MTPIESKALEHSINLIDKVRRTDIRYDVEQEFDKQLKSGITMSSNDILILVGKKQSEMNKILKEAAEWLECIKQDEK